MTCGVDADPTLERLAGGGRLVCRDQISHFRLLRPRGNRLQRVEKPLRRGEGTDPHTELLPQALWMEREIVADEIARSRLVRFGDRIFELEDLRVGGAGRAPLHFAETVARREQERAHHASLLFSSAVRRHCATISLRWLKQ